MKKVLISIAVFLAVLAALLLVSYFFRDSQWEYVLKDGESQNYGSLLTNQKIDKETYSSTYEVNRITNREGYVIVILSGENQKASLPSEIGNINDLKFPTIMPNSKVDIELNFTREKKNALQEIICTYFHSSSSCKRTLTLRSWVMSNYKPF